MRAAARAGDPPVTLALEESGRAAYACTSGAQAGAVAMMACAMLRPQSGVVYVGAFDTRIQPVQAKRIAAFVPHEPLAPGFPSLSAYIEYRADLWGVPRAQAVIRARAILDALSGVHEAFAYPLAGALISQPRLLVLDRPQAAYAHRIFDVAGDCAIFSTHAGEEDARVFALQRVPV